MKEVPQLRSEPCTLDILLNAWSVPRAWPVTCSLPDFLTVAFDVPWFATPLEDIGLDLLSVVAPDEDDWSAPDEVEDIGLDLLGVVAPDEDDWPAPDEDEDIVLDLLDVAAPDEDDVPAPDEDEDIGLDLLSVVAPDEDDCPAPDEDDRTKILEAAITRSRMVPSCSGVMSIASCQSFRRFKTSRWAGEEGVGRRSLRRSWTAKA